MLKTSKILYMKKIYSHMSRYAFPVYDTTIKGTWYTLAIISELFLDNNCTLICTLTPLPRGMAFDVFIVFKMSCYGKNPVGVIAARQFLSSFSISDSIVYFRCHVHLRVQTSDTVTFK